MGEHLRFATTSINRGAIMDRVRGKVALVTGAASGLGAASARMLAREGAVVVLADLNEAAGQGVLQDIQSQGGEAVFVRLDVADEDNWVSVMDSIRKRFGRLNIAVNCAGMNIPRSFPSDTTLADWRQLMSVNLDGVFLGTKHSLAAMQESDPVNGSIINISSVLGLVGMGDIAPYSASKGGVRLYSKSVALACAERRLNVRVNSIHPGFTDTPLVQKALERFADIEEGRRIYDALAPVGRLGEPDDIAYGVLYLASDEAKFVTGAELVIDGGFTAR
jgi:3(or 17)beta-hydroxysteroid dehydrogenase